MPLNDILRPAKFALAACLLGLGAITVNAAALLGGPRVAIHDSELTRALETMPATNGTTPIGAGTSGFEWWPTNWHYFVMPESVKEALRADGTAYEVVGDADISAGSLVDSNGSPRYPIVISLAAEAMNDSEIGPLTNYVASGGTLLVGSSAFTRFSNGSLRGDFALAGPMGVHMTNSSAQNWAASATFAKLLNHPLVTHIPGGVLTWRMPSAADEIPWGISPAHLLPPTHAIWQVQPTDATVVAQGDAQRPYLLVKQYGKGSFIYYAAMQPLIGHSGWAPGMYAYGIFRNAIQAAFAAAKMPVPKLSPWPFPYDAALNVRHDFEDYQNMISSVESSARFEFTNGAKGDYYFCTGTLRTEMTNSAAVIASLQRAVTNYGATIGPHNGGLPNPDNASLVVSNFDYWHWGPDEALNASPAGYADGKAYALASLSNGFNDVEGWLAGITNGQRAWVAPYFNATRENSYDLEQQLGVTSAGEQKLGPFPHWTLSTQTAGKRYSFISLPVSDWFVGAQVAQSMEAGHTLGTIHDAVDFYYGLGALVNVYCHSSSDGGGQVGNLVQEYVRYGMSKPRIWPANAAGVYSWWLKRSGVQVLPAYATSGNQAITTLNISGATDPQTAVEVLAASPSFSGLQVFTNGIQAPAAAYRVGGQVVKVLVGTSVTNAQILYTPLPVGQNDSYILVAGTPLTVPAPGVLTNDATGLGTNLTASLVSGPSSGTLSLTADGGFTYTPATNFNGVDSFTYVPSDGLATGNVTTVTLVVNPDVSTLFSDDFTRGSDPAPLTPWTAQSGAWSITGGQLQGGANMQQSYGFAHLDNSWTNYTVQAQLRFPAGSYGGGLGGRLNPVTGAHYAAWIYPEGSPGGSSVLKLIKFQNWTTFGYTNSVGAPMQQVSLPGVGTNWHTVVVAFQTNQIKIYYDATLMMTVTDAEAQPYLNGGISVDMWTAGTPYVLGVDNVLVTTPRADQTITFGALSDQTYGAAPFSPSATTSSGLPIAFNIVSGPATVVSNSIALTGAGTVTVRASQPGSPNYNPASSANQSFTVNPAPLTLTANDQAMTYGSAVPALTASYNGLVNGDTAAGLSGIPVLTSSAQTNSPIGAYPITVSQGSLSATNYSLTFVNGTLSISPAPLSATAANQSRAYGSANPALTGTLVGVRNNDAITASYNTSANTNSAVGNYTIVPVLAGTVSNYSVTLNSGTLTVTPAALTVTAANQSRLYGATNPAFTGTIIGAQNGENITAGYSTAAVTNSPAGNYAIVPSVSGPLSNYAVTTNNGTLTVNPAPLTVSADNKSRVFGITNPPLTFTCAGFVNGEVLSVLSGSPALSTPAQTNSPVGVFPIQISLGTLSNANYAFSFTNGTLTIGATAGGVLFADDFSRPLNPGSLSPWVVQQGAWAVTNGVMQGSGAGNTYSYAYLDSSWTDYSVQGQIQFSSSAAWAGGIGGRLNPLTGAHYGAWVYPDGSLGGARVLKLIKFSGWTTWSGTPMTQVTLPAVGTNWHTLKLAFLTNQLSLYYNGVLLTNVVDNGFDSQPVFLSGGITAEMFTDTTTTYVLSFDNVVASVMKPTLSITANDASRTYGASNPVLTGTITGLRNGDNVTATYSTAADTNTPPGTYTIVPAVSDPNNLLTNYFLVTTNGTLTVTPAALAVTVNNQSRLYGAANPTLTGTLAGVQNGDDITVSYSTTADISSPAGSYSIVPALNDPGHKLPNYNVTTNLAALTILPAPLTVTADNKSRTYGAVNPPFTGSVLGILNNDSIVASYGTAATPASPVGTYAIVPALSGPLANYLITTNNGLLNVTAAALTGVADARSRLYGQTNPAFPVTYAGFVNGENATIVTGTLIGSTTAVTNSPVGTYPITVSGQSAPNYLITYVPGVLTIGPAPVLVTANNASRAYGQANPAFSATITGFVNAEDTNVLGGTLSFSTTADTNTSIGTYPIVPGGLTSTNYSLTFSNGTLTVTAFALTVTANNQSRTYGAANPALTGTLTGVQNGDSITAGFSTTAAAASPVGTYSIVPALNDPNGKLSNYTVTTNNGVLTVTPAVLTASADNQSKIYGSANPTLTGTLTGVQNGDDITASYSTTADATSPVNTYSIVPALSDPSGKLTNYNVSLKNGTLIVMQAPLTVTADGKSRSYGASNPVLTATITGFVNGDTTGTAVTGAAGLSTTATVASGIGPYPITATLGSLAAANYSFGFVNGTLNVTPAALLGRADDKSRLYGQTNPVFTATYSGFVNGENAGIVSGTLIGSTTAQTNSPVGTYPISVSGQSAPNYAISYVAGTLTIGPTPLLVTANDASRAYGQTNPIFTASFTGFVDGENTNALSGALAFSTTADTNSPVGAYPIVASGLTSTNYSVTFSNGTLTVSAYALVVSANSQSRTYGAANPTLTGTLTGVQNGDNITATFSTAAIVTDPVGTYSIVPALNDPGSKLVNYAVTTNNGTLTISAAPLTVTADNQTRAYGALNPTLTGIVNGIQNSESISATYSTSAGQTSPVGIYAIVPSVTGPLSNYVVTVNNGTLSVTQAVLTVTADNQSRTFGAPNPPLTFGYSGFVNGENAGVLSGQPRLSTAAQTNSPVWTYPIIVSVGTLSNANYAFAFQNGTLTVTPTSQGILFADDFSRSSDPGPLSPWTAQQGTWNVTGGQLQGGTNTLQTYAFAHAASAWSNYTVQGRIQFPAGAYGGGLGGRLNAASGAHYGAWVYPEGSPGGSSVLKLIKFQNWTNFEYNQVSTVPIQQVSLPGVGTNWHTLEVTFLDNQIRVYYDSTLVMTATDDEAQPYTQGGISADMWTPGDAYVMSVDDVVVTGPKTDQAISFAAPAARTYGDAPVALAATASSGLPVALTLVSGPATLSSNTLTLTGAGLVTVQAAQAGDYTYNAAATVQRSFTVNPATLTVTVSNQTQVYGAALPALTAGLSGFVNGETGGVVAGSPALSTSAQPGSGIGAYPITGAQGTLSAANYTFTFVNGVLTITPAALSVTANNQTRIYGGVNPPLTGVLAGIQNGDAITASYSTAADPSSHLGSYAITPSLSGPLANYTVTSSNGTLVIMPAALTLAADNQTKVYGTANPALTGTLAGVQNGDAITAGYSTAATVSSSVGSYTILAALSDPAGKLGNYSVVISNGTLNITPAALTVSANNQFRTYGTANPVLTGTIVGIANNDPITATYSTVANAGSPVGSYPIIPAVLGPLSNYQVTVSNGALSILPAGLLVQANNLSRSFGTVNPPLTVAYIGLVNGETASVLNGTPSLSTPAQTNSPAGTYPIFVTAGTLSNSNYSLSLSNGTLTITPTAAGLLFADDFSRMNAESVFPWVVQQGVWAVTNGVLEAFSSTNDYSYAYLDSGWTDYSLEGQFQFSSTAGWGGGFGGRLNKVTGAHYGAWVYPENSHGGTMLLRLIKFVNWTSWSGTPMAQVALPSVGTNWHTLKLAFQTNQIAIDYDGLRVASVIDNGFDSQPAFLTGGVSADQYTDSSAAYTLSFDNVTVKAARPALSVTANNASRTYGAANPVFTGSMVGLQGGDNINVTFSTLADTNSPAGVYAIVPVFDDPDNKLGNYNLFITNGTLTVTRAALALAADSKTRIYGAANPTLTGALTGVLNGDNITASYSTTADATSGVGTYSIVPSLNDPGHKLDNYTVSTNNGTLTVNPAALTVTADNQTGTYGSANPPLTAAITGFVNGDTAASALTGQPNLTTSANVASGVGPYSITAALGTLSATNYTFNFSPGTLSITPAPLVGTADSKIRLYGQTNPVFTVTYTGFVNNENAGIVTGTLSGSTSANTNSPVGTYSITVSGQTAPNYILTYLPGTLTVNPAALLVKANDASRAYAQTNPIFTATFSGFANGEDSNVLSGTLAFNTAADTNSPVGTYPIAPSGLVSTNYSLTFSNGTLTITPFALTVAADSKAKTYGAANPTLTGALTGVQNGDNITASYSTAADATSGVGTYSIVPSLNDPGHKLGNYSVSTNNGTLTVNTAALTVTADNQTKIYGAALPALTGLLTGAQNGDNITASYSTTANATSSVGTYSIVPTLNDPNSRLGNYLVTTNHGTLSVTPAPLNVTADNQTKAYGSANPTLTATITGFVNGDTAPAALSGQPSLTTSANLASGVGPYAITAAIGTLSATNYTFNFSPGTLSVTPASLVGTADSKIRLYGQTNPVFTVTYTGFVNNENAGIVTGTLSGSTSADTNSPVGTYPITVSGQTAPNYTLTYLPGTLTVNPAALLVKANDASRAYGQTNPIFTATFSGFANGEGSNVLGGTLVFNTADTNSPVGTYPIAPSGLAATNYSLMFSNGTLTITPYALMVAADSKTKTYGAANPTLTGTLNGVQNGDNITASYTTAADATSGVGAYSIVPSLNDPGQKLGNYSVNTNNGTLTVNAAALNVAADDQTKVYGAVVPTLTGHLTGVQNGDNITAGYSTTADATSAVGTYSIVPALNDPNGKLGNYLLTTNNGTLTVTAAPLTVTADSQTKTYGSANPTLTATITGFVNGDTATTALSGQPSLTTSANNASGVGTYAINAATGTLSATNYTFNFSPGTLTVNPAALFVQANDATRAYGQTNPVFTATLNGFVTGEDSNVLSGTLVFNTAAETNSPVGLYPIAPSGLVSANYSLTFANGTLTVTQANSSTALISSHNPSAQSSNVTFVVAVTPIAPATTTPTGLVQFFTNSVALGSPVTLSAGTASISTALLPVGSNTVMAAYLGDGNFLPSTNSLVQVVTANAQPPVALGIHKNGDGTVTVTFRGTPGAQYIVRATSDLSSTNSWANLSTNVAGADGLWTFTESMAGHTQRYYRAALATALVVVEPLPQRPSALGIKSSGAGTITATFQGTPGAQYLVLATRSLAAPIIWTTVATNTAGTDGRWTLTESRTNGPQRFFRPTLP